MIRCENIRKSFSGSQVLGGVSFCLAEGEFVSILGPNGCGKSTLLKILCGMDSADSGTLYGVEKLKSSIGYVHQDFRRSLFPWRTAAENILFPLHVRGVSKKECQQKLGKLVESFCPQFNLYRPVFTLSGGEAQNVSLLRALIVEPKVLLLDEPFSALDLENTLRLRELLVQVCQKQQLSTVLVSHDIEEAVYLADRVLFLSRKPSFLEAEYKVSFPRPRNRTVLVSTEFAEAKQQVLDIFTMSSHCFPEPKLPASKRGNA